MFNDIILLFLLLIALRASDTAFDGLKARRRERQLEAAHRRRLELAEKAGDVASLLITDAALAGDVYDQLERKLESEKEPGAMQASEPPKLAAGDHSP